MNYIGVVCLIGPLDCVKILGYHASDAKAQTIARAAAEIPLEVAIPAGEQRFVGFDFASPDGFAPSTETSVWQIAARLIAPGNFVVPVGIEIAGDRIPT